MQKMKVITFLLILIIPIYGCESDGLSDSEQDLARDVKTNGDLEFIYQVTVMEGNPQNTFSEGENFMFSFVVKNHGDEDIWVFDRWDLLYTIDDFFALYKTNNQGNGKMLIGRSFEISASSYELPGRQWVPNHGEIEYRISWLTQSDTSYIMPAYRPNRNLYNERNYRAVEPLPEPLLAGQYHSGFNLEHQGEEISFDVQFVVK